MIDNQRVLAVVPARGGSKGIPRKNLRYVGGKPMLAWTIESAKHSRYVDRVILSSEDDEIIEVAQSWGCEVPFIRPAELSRDDTSGIAPVMHALGEVPGYDFVVLLQPTSPLRTSEDLDSCIEYCLEKDAPVCVSVTRSAKSPCWMYSLNHETQLRPVLDGDWGACRQDLPSVYELNGAVYVARVDWLLEKKTFMSDATVGYEMPRERSIDVDEAQDLLYLDFLLNSNES